MRPRWWGFLRDACEKRAWRGWEDPPPPPQGLVLRCQEGKPGSHRRRDNGALGENREGNWWRGGPSRGSVHTGRCNHQARAALHPFMGPHSTKTETPGWSWGGQMRTGQELGLSICEEGSGILAQGTNWDKPTHKRTGAAVLAAASLGKCKWPSLPTHALLAQGKGPQEPRGRRTFPLGETTSGATPASLAGLGSPRATVEAYSPRGGGSLRLAWSVRKDISRGPLHMAPQRHWETPV